MAIFKCKMCGGDLNIEADSRVVGCEYCGTTQTVPAADDEKKLNLFNRANKLRLNSEFDKATSIYESIIAEFPQEAEAYWGLCLCNYGIEYVDDPATSKKVPTCHRASFEKIANDDNFRLALQYADVVASKVYLDEAKEIDRIMDEILSVSKNEKPYDVFICYKETDKKGERTIDSVLAQDIYDALTAKGMKVFFARITLEDKLGRMYEPYIFAALNSAKVMLAIGTKEEHYNAVWVKNEWSRYLKLMAKDKSKVLIPCFKDMDAYDTPDEFKALQAQDMSKIGFMQDLVYGVSKIVNSDKSSANSSDSYGDRASVASLLKRIFIFIEDGDWFSASKYCEKVLDIDPENAMAYVGKLMIDLKVSKKEHLKNADTLFHTNKNYLKAIRYADAVLKAELEEYKNILAYTKAENQVRNISSENEFNTAAYLFEVASGYKDADERREECIRNAEELRKECEYQKAIRLFNADATSDVDKAVAIFKELDGYKDSSVYYSKCDERKVEIEKDDIYKKATLLMNSKKDVKYDCQQAADMFLSISDWKDSEEMTKNCKQRVQDAVNDEIYAFAYKNFNDAKNIGIFSSGSKAKIIKALELFEQIPGWKVADEKAEECRRFLSEIQAKADEDLKKNQAIAKAKAKAEKKKKTKKSVTRLIIALLIIGIPSAIALFVLVINPNKKFDTAKAYYESQEYEKSYEILSKLDSKILDDKLPPVKYELAKVFEGEKEYYKSAVMYDQAGEYENSKDKFLVMWKFVLDSWKDKQKPTSVAVSSDIIVALKNDGTVVATGDDDYGELNVSEWKDVYSVATSGSHTVGLKTDGTVVATGEEKACKVAEWKYIVAVFVEGDITVGLRGDGTVVVSTGLSRRALITKWTDITDIKISMNAVIGLKSDGTVVSAGKNKNGVRNVSSWSDIVQIETGYYGTVGLKSDGTFVSTKKNMFRYWSADEYNDIVCFAYSNVNDIIALREKGKIISTFGESSEWSNIKAVYSFSYALALTNDGKIKSTINDTHWAYEAMKWTNIQDIYVVTNSFILGRQKDGKFIMCYNADYSEGLYSQMNDDIKEWTEIKKY